MEVENPFEPFGGLLVSGSDGGLVDEIRRKHANSPASASGRIIAVTSSVLEVLKSQSVDPKPTALFAALLATLERQETLGNTEVACAICTVLSMAALRVSRSILDDKCAQSLKLFNTLMEVHSDKYTLIVPKATMKAALKCMGQFLSAGHSLPDDSICDYFNVILQASWNATPSIRKVAIISLQEVLTAYMDTPVAHHLHTRLSEVCRELLLEPGRTAEIAAAAPKKQRREKENDIRKAVLTAFHILACLGEVLPLLEGSHVMKICDSLTQLFSLKQHLLSISSCDVIGKLFLSARQQLGADSLSQLLKVLLENIAVKNTSERELTCALCGILEKGFCKLYKLDQTGCFQQLPDVVHFLTQQLAAEHDGVRYAAMQSLTSLLSTCLDKSMVSSEVALRSQRAQRSSPLDRIVVSVASTLGPRYQDAQTMALPVVKSLIEKLGREGASFAYGMIEQIGVVYGALVEASEDEEPSDELNHYLAMGESTLGAAIKHMSPEAVLEVIPLNVLQGLESEAVEHRSWLLPLLRKYVVNGSLKFWATHLLPYARELGNRAAQANSVKRTQMAAKCNALELQIWSSLPSFCCWCQDADSAFGECVQAIGAAFSRRLDIRHTVCRALQYMACQSRTVLISSNHRLDLCGFSEPPGLDSDGFLSHTEENSSMIPSHFTPDLAARTVQAMRAHSAQWLQAFYNGYTVTDPSGRGPIFGAIAAYSTITEPSVLAEFFRMILENLIKCLQGGDAAGSVHMPGNHNELETQCIFMELLLSIAGGLDDAGIGHLYKVVLHTLEAKQPAIQKKAYKLLSYIVNSRHSFVEPRLQEIMEKLKSALVHCLPPAKRFRMFCLVPIIKQLRAHESLQYDESVRLFIGEILFCTKEQNRKTVDEAYKLLVSLAEDAIEGPQGFLGFLNIVMGGLLSETPHTISATVQGLSRLVHKFYKLLQSVAEKLLMTVLMLIRAQCKEVDAAVLGFINVCAMKYHDDILDRRLPEILEAVLVWRDDPKCKLRVKVRMVVTRLAAKCGFDRVEALIPGNYCKAFTHLRKAASRKDRKRREGTSNLEDDEADNMEVDGQSPGSEWAHSKFFPNYSNTAKSPGGKSTKAGQSKGGKTSQRSKSVPFRFGQLAEGSEPLDMLDSSSSRMLARSAAGIVEGNSAAHDDEEDGPMKLPVNEDGKLLINEKTLVKEQKRENKRKKNAAADSDEDETRTHKSGASGHTRRSSKSKGSSKPSQSSRGKINSHHSGQRFKANRGAGGDLQGTSKLEPFAYWKMDRSLLSRRRGKKAASLRDLGKVVNRSGQKNKRFKAS